MNLEDLERERRESRARRMKIADAAAANLKAKPLLGPIVAGWRLEGKAARQERQRQRREAREEREAEG